MKLWKSPVLYFGILLVLAVAGALAAPYVIAWDTYRPDIEAYGRKLTGRAVTVRGPIDVRLFPWPNIKLTGIEVANPEGASTPDFMRAAEVEVSVSLAGLANGEIRVESIKVRKPEFWIERMATARGTWEFEPEIDPLRARLGERFRLDQIAIEDGVVHLVESMRGGEATLEDVDATVSGTEISGPWRIRGTADYLGRKIDLALNTGIWKSGEAFKFGVRVAPSDGSGLVYALDGSNTNGRFQGALRIDPAAAAGAKADAEGTFRPLVLNSTVSADFDRIEFDKIEIAPRDSDGSNLLAGKATITLGEEIRLDSDLSATRFDLDTVAGAQAKSFIREGNSLELLEALVDALPDRLEASVKIKVLSLIAGGESIENVRAGFRAGGGTIRIDELSAKMPGQAAGLFSGVFAATDQGPQLAGDLAFEAFNLREFVRWLAPERKDDIEKAWTGSRGLFKLEGRLDAAGDSLRLTEARFQIDDTMGSGTAALAGGTRTSADFNIKTGMIDIDAFIPQGVQIRASADSSGWSDVASLLAPIIPDSLKLKIAADSIRLNGVEAAHVVIDTDSNLAGVAIHSFKAGSLGNAQLEATGQVNFTSEGPKGSGDAAVRAGDPRDVLKLLGIIPAGLPPAWTRGLGVTEMTFKLGLEPGKNGPSLSVRTNGTTGDLRIVGDASMLGSLDWTMGIIQGSVEVTSATSAAILRLAGFEPTQVDQSPGKLVLTVSGSLQDKLLTDLQADVLRAGFSQKGTVTYKGGNFESEGQAAISAERSQQLLRALGLHAADDGVLTVESPYVYKSGALALPAIKGIWHQDTFAGGFTVSKSGELSGELQMASADLPSILAAAFLPWNGQRLDLEAGFVAAWPLGLSGEVWLRPKQLRLVDGYSLTESQIGITNDSGGKRLAVFGTSPSGAKTSIDAGVVPQGELYALDGSVEMTFDMGLVRTVPENFAVADGMAHVDMKFSGNGRSPAAALADLKGGGSYNIDRLKLMRIDTMGFLSVLASAKTAEDVKKAFVTLTSGGEVELGDVGGSITIVDGIAALLPVKVSLADTNFELRPLVEAASGIVDINVQLAFKGAAALPGMEINYSGQPNALSRSVDAAQLESHVGMQVLQKAMQELEAVQREQQRILEEEAKQAKIDAERLADWDSHRKELQRRLREQKTYERMREEDARRYAVWIADLAKMAKAELAQRTRELKIQRRIRQEQERTQKDAAATLPGTREPETAIPVNQPAKPKVKPKPRQRAVLEKPEEPFVPLVLVPPAAPPPAPPPEARSSGSILDFFGLTGKKSTGTVGN